MGNHILLLASRFSRLTAMRFIVEEQMEVAILFSSFSMATEYSAVRASVCIISVKNAIWEYLSMLFIEKQKRFQVNRTSQILLPQVGLGKLALSKRRSRVLGCGQKNNARCIKSGAKSHLTRQCQNTDQGAWSKITQDQSRFNKK